MKKWLKFFGLSFFSHKQAKEGARRGYTNMFLGFILALVFLYASFLLGDMLPFGAHYESSPDFKDSIYAVFTNDDAALRIDGEIKDGRLRLKEQGGEYAEALLINTFENETDRKNYSVNGFNVVLDTRPADALAEIEAYYVSSDGSGKRISYEDYLSLNEVARLNFDFKIEYTGKELQLDGETVEKYRAYVDGLSTENKGRTEKLAADLSENTITKDEYNRAIYELYFETYYPEITAYESASKVPLLRNYYYHGYVREGGEKYLFIFDDCMTGAFETKGGVEVSFYGFYGNLDDGAIVSEGASKKEAEASVDRFIRNSYGENLIINAYGYLVNVITIAPFIALMFLVATLLGYSVMKLCGVDSITTFGATFKIVGSFAWFSGVISTLISLIASFFIARSFVVTLPLIVFFVTLAVRSVIFVLTERKLYIKQSEQEESTQGEV